MIQNKMMPALWFHSHGGKMKEVTDYYIAIFGNGFEAGNVIPLGETPSGYTEMCNIKIFENEYLWMATAIEHHAFNDAFSIILHCEGQEEIDKYWNYFTQKGKESMCGWCMDKFGLRWQIIPKNFSELMSRPNAGQIMMKQKKIIINDYLK